MTSVGAPHHYEIWVPEIKRAAREWGWLLEALTYRRDTLDPKWPCGRIWRHVSGFYVVIEQSVDLLEGEHDRCRPGVNHIAFMARSQGAIEGIVADARDHGWTLMFPDEHPFAGGKGSYVAYLHNSDGYEVELRC